MFVSLVQNGVKLNMNSHHLQLKHKELWLENERFNQLLRPTSIFNVEFLWAASELNNSRIFSCKEDKWMLSLRAGLICLVLAWRWLLTGGLSLPCFLFTATLVARRRVRLCTRLAETPQQPLKFVWNYISAVLWTTCKWNVSQYCLKCHLSPLFGFLQPCRRTAGSTRGLFTWSNGKSNQTSQ